MRINDHVHMLTIPFTVLTPNGAIPRSVNVFFVCGDTVTLIDTGVAGSEEAIFGYLKGIGRSRREITRVILTHSHPDHIGSATAIRTAVGCEVLAGNGERRWIEDTELQFRERPVPGFHTLVAGPVPVARVIGEGDILPVAGEVSLEVIETPGHSAGSLSFLIHPFEILVTGDAIPLPGDMPVYDDHRESVASLQRLAGVSGAKVVLESWREPGLDVGQRLAEGLEWLRVVDAAVVRVMGSGIRPDPMELCRGVVTELGLPPYAVNPLVSRSLESHL